MVNKLKKILFEQHGFIKKQIKPSCSNCYNNNSTIRENLNLNYHMAPYDWPDILLEIYCLYFDMFLHFQSIQIVLRQ